ncbi:hypothetical protein DFH28DRAFT_914991 [Melampsora americana]|nr:hypothetical protein DFH28DRAFT_914991 [Melampsora americana]
MADHTSQYIYPVKSVVLPKRLHSFLAYHLADPVLDATTREYHQIFEVFYPKMALPLNLGKDVVIRIFQITVLPFLRRQKSFDKDTCIFSYISINAHPEHEKPYPTRSLVLPQKLANFIRIHDDPDMEFTPEEYHQMIDIFFPQLQLPRSFDQETLIGIFEIMVLPFLHRLDDYDEDSGFIRFLTVEVLPQNRPNTVPIQSVILPVNLRGFLAFIDPKVAILAGPTSHDFHQIIELFHPYLDGFFKPTDDLMQPFKLMILPYIRNTMSFNYQDNKLTYYAVNL